MTLYKQDYMEIEDFVSFEKIENVNLFFSIIFKLNGSLMPFLYSNKINATT